MDSTAVQVRLGLTSDYTLGRTSHGTILPKLRCSQHGHPLLRQLRHPRCRDCSERGTDCARRACAASDGRSAATVPSRDAAEFGSH
jgi:hypothetical protein